jgi:HD-GYP domain-containing protein (c-di-GMP phosphodiesterase class II)
MRRILVNYAEPGMILARDLHDGYGHVLLDKGTQLGPEHVQALARVGVSELLIEDDRVNDVVIAPLISPELRGAAAEALTQILARLEGAQEPERTGVGMGQMRPGASSTGAATQHQAGIGSDLTLIRRVAFEMAQQLAPASTGDATISGCHSAEDYDFVLPVKIAEISLLMGKVAGLNQTQLVNLGMAALLQNIGYTRVFPHNLTQKPGVLWEELAFVRAWRTGRNGPDHEKTPVTAAELQAVWKHPEHSVEILKQANAVDAELLEIILQHHERWNGSGYPRELRAGQILPSARILAITDTSCTMASQRPYREAFLPLEVAELIVAYSGELYDPEMVRIFIENVPTFPTGAMVKLNTGEVGIVTDSNVGLIGRPKVRMCNGQDGRPIARPYEVDLAEPQNRQKLIATTVEY